ncbi:MAG: selenocysteine-specific translation elongation factor [Raoultibacter sp.]
MEASPTPCLILGTAGHIDHGKSTLVAALTGTDPDRLAEEKRRGITIELGFAQLHLPSGRTMGVVDVPGHERFVRQMIAGSSGIDVALLVIAADDGIMPQTIEHLRVLELLEIPACVVALTKSDLVDAEWLEFVTGEIRSFLSAGPFAACPIVAVSAEGRTGLVALTEAIDAVAAATTDTIHASNAARLPIDRVFTIKGAGTVVTGTLWSGTLAPEDTVELLPSHLTTRIRAVQVHGSDVSMATPGNRVALNLNAIKKTDIHPGDFLTAPDSIVPTDRFDATLHYLDGGKKTKPLQSGTRVHIAHGTREVTGRVLFMNGKNQLMPQQSAIAQIRLEEALPLSYRDHFIIRSYSPVTVIGGGMVLSAHPRRRTNLAEGEEALLAALQNGSEGEIVACSLALQRNPLTTAELARATGLDEGTAATCLQDAALAPDLTQLAEGVGAPRFILTKTLNRRVADITATLKTFHANNPSSTTISKSALQQLCNKMVTPECFDLLLAQAVAAHGAVIIEGQVSHPEAGAAAQHLEQQAASALLAAIKAAPLTPPSLQEAANSADIALPLARKAIASLEKQALVQRASKDIYFDTETIEGFKRACAASLAHDATGSVAQLKEAMGTSRKYAVPLLELFDAQGFTKRNGDGRSLNKTS